MGNEISQIRIGQHQVGLIGLKDALTEVRSLGLNNPEDIKTEIIQRLRVANYITPQVEADYGEAVLREYRRSCGEDVPEDTGILEIRVLGQGCMRCEELMHRVMAVVAELKLPADVQHIRDLNRIAEYGMVATPGLVINGKLKSVGKVLSVKELKEMLR
jgi:small redox-active disulfide protein 2